MKLSSTLFAATVLLSSASAFAQSDSECSTDADCPDNFACVTYETGGCPSCIDGEDCPPCEVSSGSYCEPGPPPTCDDTTPCAGDDVCVTYTFEACPSRPPCIDGEPCDDTPEPECEAESESYCVPPYLAPCQADADCGDGFTCEAVEVCECSGSAGSGSTGTDGSGSSDGEDPVPDESCSCSPTGDNYCQLIEVECTSDDDCSGDLTCQENYGGGVAVDVPCSSDAPDDCATPEPVESVSHCAPVDYGYYGGSGEDAVAEATGRDDGSVTNSEREEFFPVDGTSEGSGTKSEASGCSTTSSSDASLLGVLFGTLFMGLRRRR